MGDDSDRITAVLDEHLKGKHFALESKSEIGVFVSSELRSKAIVAIVLSLLGVVLYLRIRSPVCSLSVKILWNSLLRIFKGVVEKIWTRKKIRTSIS